MAVTKAIRNTKGHRANHLYRRRMMPPWRFRRVQRPWRRAETLQDRSRLFATLKPMPGTWARTVTRNRKSSHRPLRGGYADHRSRLSQRICDVLHGVLLAERRCARKWSAPPKLVWSMVDCTYYMRRECHFISQLNGNGFRGHVTLLPAAERRIERSIRLAGARRLFLGTGCGYLSTHR